MDTTRPSLAIVIEGLKKSFLDAKSRGVRLRYLTEITSQNISYCKELISIVDELRHLDRIKGNFYISEIEYLAPATLHEKTKPASQIIYSNVKGIVRHEQYVFDTFWNKAIPAEEKIREIEEGVLPNFIEILRNPIEFQKKAYELIKSATNEILIIFSTSNAFHRQMERAGLMKLLKKEALAKPDLTIRILTPVDDTIKEIVQKFKRKGKGEEEQLKKLTFYTSNSPHYKLIESQF